MDDTTRGRFVADQVRALRSTGVVDEAVISFEPAQLTGGAVDRQRQAAAVRQIAAPAVRTDPAVFASRAWSGPAGIPVARLPVPMGNRAFATAIHAAEDRRIALGWIAGRLASPLPTIIHAHTGYPDGSAATALMTPLRAPLVITEHATFVGQLLAQPDVRRAYADGIHAASRLIAVSDHLADELRNALPECGRKVVVIPNTVSMDDFRPISPEARRPDELLYVGYRTETKGIDVLLAAFARVRAARSTATLRLVGRSPTPEIEEGWRRLAGELGIGDSVVFEEPRLRAGVAAAMAEAAILVHASRRETFGVAPVEALASGLPVVATDTGPLREILGPDPAGLGALVAVGDAEALASAVLATLDRRLTFDPLHLRMAVEDRFGDAAVARRIVDLYREVLHESGATMPTEAASRVGEPVDGAADRPSRRVVVVGFDTPKVARLLASMPAEQRRDLALVCSAGPYLGTLPGDLAQVTAVDVSSVQEGMPGRPSPAGPRGSMLVRLRRLVRDPRATVRRRLLTRRRDRLLVRAVDGALADLTPATGSPGGLHVVCVDGLDYLAAEGTVAAGRARGAPGGLRWLTDQHHATGSRSLAHAAARPGREAMVHAAGARSE